MVLTVMSICRFFRVVNLILSSGGKPLSNTPGRAATVVLVYFLGGCSYSEISALRFLGKQTGIVS